MNKTEFSRIHKKMKQAFDEETINGFGYTTGFLKRKRKVTPFSLASTLICLLTTQKVESLADLQRDFLPEANSLDQKLILTDRGDQDLDYCNEVEEAGIVEGLLWASLVASLVKHFLSHATSIVFGGIETSTRRTVMILIDHLRDLFRRIVQGKQFRSVFRELFNFLEKYARLAHPKRDKKVGRLSSGLQHISGEVAHG